MWQELIVYIVVAACAAYVLKNLLTFFRKGGKGTTACNCGCSGCPHASRKACEGKRPEKKSAERLQIQK